MTLSELNGSDAGAATTELLRCCGSRRWAGQVASSRPFPTREALFETAEKIWNRLGPSDWLEAFSHHPRIGDVASLRTKFAATSSWASDEQKGAANASEQVLSRLADGNAAYERKFSHIFLVCATGKTAEQMLTLLETRLENDPETEIRVAAAEQAKITRIRLEKLLS